MRFFGAAFLGLGLGAGLGLSLKTWVVAASNPSEMRRALFWARVRVFSQRGVFDLHTFSMFAALSFSYADGISNLHALL